MYLPLYSSEPFSSKNERSRGGDGDTITLFCGAMGASTDEFSLGGDEAADSTAATSMDSFSSAETPVFVDVSMTGAATCAVATLSALASTTAGTLTFWSVPTSDALKPCTAAAS